MTFSHTQVMLTRSHELTHLGAYETMVVRVSEWDLWQSDCEFKKKTSLFRDSVSWKKFSLFRDSKSHLPIPKKLTLNFVTWYTLKFKWYKINLEKKECSMLLWPYAKRRKLPFLFSQSKFLQSTLKMKSNFSEILMLTSLATSSYISNIWHLAT